MWTAQEIHALLAEVARADPGRSVFGAKRHHYRLNPPCPEATVAEFERTNGITLPEDYRRFVTEVGDGGAGPYYGLNYHQLSANISNLTQPFSLTESGDMPDEGVTGGLFLAEQGCGTGTWLIVRGLSYGTVWEGCDDISPTGLSFWQWYEQWLLKLREHVLPVLASEQ